MAEKWSLCPKNNQDAPEEEVLLNLQRNSFYSCRDVTLQGIKTSYQSVVITASGAWEDITILTNRAECSPERNNPINATGVHDRIRTAAMWAKGNYSQTEDGTSGYPCMRTKMSLTSHRMQTIN